MIQINCENGTTSVRVRVEGRLVSVHADGSRFTLRTTEGDDIHGKLIIRSIVDLARLLTREIVVFGTLNPDGSGLEGDGFLPLVGPVVMSVELLPLTPDEAREMSARFATIIGAWPGDETDEQIEEALKRLS